MNKWKGGRKAAQERYRTNNRERFLENRRKWYAKNKKKVRQSQLKYQRENREKLYAYNRKWVQQYRAKLREELFAAYGGKCVCCGESNPYFLELDHINNDGASERRKHGNQFVEWVTLRKRGFPKEKHQLLCANCNKGKLRNGGICPHKTASQS